MGVRRRLGWYVSGSRTTDDLQVRVADLERQVAALTKELALLRDRQLDEFDKVREAVAAATDDLMVRLDALRQQVDKS